MEGIVGQFTADNLFPVFRRKAGSELFREQLCMGTNRFDIRFKDSTGMVQTMVLVYLRDDEVVVQAGRVVDACLQEDALNQLCSPEQTFTCNVHKFGLSSLRSATGMEFLKYMTLVGKELLMVLVLAGRGTAVEIQRTANNGEWFSLRIIITFDRFIDDVVKLGVNIDPNDDVNLASVFKAKGYIKNAGLVFSKRSDGRQIVNVEEFRSFIQRCRHDKHFGSLFEIEQRLDRLLSSC